MTKITQLEGLHGDLWGADVPVNQMADLSSSLCLSAFLHHIFLPRPQPVWPDPGISGDPYECIPLSSLFHLQDLSTQHG